MQSGVGGRRGVQPGVGGRRGVRPGVGGRRGVRLGVGGRRGQEWEECPLMWFPDGFTQSLPERGPWKRTGELAKTGTTSRTVAVHICSLWPLYFLLSLF